MAAARSGDDAEPEARALPCGGPCGLFVSGVRRPGTLWNVSMGGGFIALPEPLPVPGTRVVVTFSLPGERTPIAAEGRVRWPNEPSPCRFSDALGRQPSEGCAVEFVGLDATDRQRIAACIGRAPL